MSGSSEAEKIRLALAGAARAHRHRVLSDQRPWMLKTPGPFQKPVAQSAQRLSLQSLNRLSAALLLSPEAAAFFKKMKIFAEPVVAAAPPWFNREQL